MVRNAEVNPYRRNDTTPGFTTNKWDSETVRKINKGSRFRSFNAEETWFLGDLLDALKDEVAACLGSPWLVLSLKAWPPGLPPESGPP
jgi:hypothetical protein